MPKEPKRGAKGSSRANALTARPKIATVAAPEPDEAEALRLQLLAEAGEMKEAPGQLDALLDRAYLADSFFEEHVLQHPACLRSPELFREAWAVARALADLYQRIGQELGQEPSRGAAVADAVDTKP